MAKALSKMVLNGVVSFKSSRATSMVRRDIVVIEPFTKNHVVHIHVTFSNQHKIKIRISSNFQASGSLYHYGMGFSTTAPNDPDTHDDFKPTNKLENSGVTLKDIIEQVICSCK